MAWSTPPSTTRLRPVLLALRLNGPQMTSGSTREFMALCAIHQYFGRLAPRLTSFHSEGVLMWNGLSRDRFAWWMAWFRAGVVSGRGSGRGGGLGALEMARCAGTAWIGWPPHWLAATLM